MNKLAPLLKELAAETTLAVYENDFKYSNASMQDAYFIFINVFLGKLIDTDQKATELGIELRALMLKYTGLDLHKLANE